MPTPQSSMKQLAMVSVDPDRCGVSVDRTEPAHLPQHQLSTRRLVLSSVESGTMLLIKLACSAKGLGH